MFRMIAEVADFQVRRLRTTAQTLEESRKTLESLMAGQTATLWTADGQSVRLTSELRKRYESSQKWLDEIAQQINDAHINLQKAIDETTELDEAQKDHYRKMLHEAFGDSAPIEPVPSPTIEA